MLRKQVVVVGNCQAAFTAKIYRESFGAANLEDVRYVDDYGLDDETAWAAVGQADVVLMQQREGASRADSAPPGVHVQTFPLILEAFLWPYAHEAHIRNGPEPPLADGPYPAQLGDKFLNRLISQGVSPEEALEQYLAHDIAGATHIDRLYELHIEQQRDRDQRTGFDIASVLESGFRREALFMSPHHPNAWMFGAFLSQLFEKMSLGAEVIEAMTQSMLKSPYPSGELPIHPGVIKHFGLQFADENTRFKFHNEGRFTFAEHVIRYMRYEHNHQIRSGVQLFHWGDNAGALTYLDPGLERSPKSADGWHAKGLSLARLGRLPEAADAFRHTMELAPQEPDAFADLARVLMDMGDLAQAEAQARAAVAMSPYYGPGQLILAELMLRASDLPAAIQAGREAARLLPSEAACCWWTALAYWGSGDTANTRLYCERGLRLKPDACDPRNLLAETYEHEGERDVAIAILEEGVRLNGVNDQTFSLIGNFHLRKALADESQKRVELERAMASFKRGLELQPNRHEFEDQIREMEARIAALPPKRSGYGQALLRSVRNFRR